MQVITLALDVFLTITYLGISIYLARIYHKWRETSIGVWSVSSLLVTIAAFIHLLSDYQFVDDLIIFNRISLIIGFISFSTFSMAHQMARRTLLDQIIISIFSFINGVLAIFLLNTMEMGILNDLVVLDRSREFETLDVILLIYLLIFYLIIVRESEILYRSTIKNSSVSFIKSTAITHFISWQFFVLGGFIFWFSSKFAEPTSSINHMIFEYMLILLLVPLLTLGSRPFDWAREGYEPKQLLLLDDRGNIAYSWSKKDMEISLLSGSTFTSIIDMIKNLIEQDLEAISFTLEKDALYLRSGNKFLSVLQTTGPHPSFDLMLGKIHNILVKKVEKPIEFGESETKLPDELKWLLVQLLANPEF
ncbi:MAG: hypothetical protein INQ03_15245 [Candidatus Heimdallarchaeota archaeon]|nr:hypothetical protein [Candidatus Heimdallarchaeota archaeon]